MNKSEISTFTPEYDFTVDDRRYMGDLTIDNAHIMESYQSLIANNRYTDAANLLEQSEDVFSFSAWFFNMLNNRLKAISYYLTRVIEPRPELTKYQDPEPPGVPLWTTWITESDDFSTLHDITIRETQNGSVVSVPQRDITGATIQLYVLSDFGYAIDRWEVVSGGVQIQSDDSFVLGNSDVVIQPVLKLESMINFPVHLSNYLPTDLTSNGAVWIDLGIDASNNNVIYSDNEPTGVPDGSCWIGDN